MKTSRGPCLIFQNYVEVDEVVWYGLSCQRLLTSPKQQAEKHSHYPGQEEDHLRFLEVQFRYCVRLGRQTESGCRDCWQRGGQRAEKEPADYNYLGDEGRIGDRAIVLKFILLKRFLLMRV